MKTLTLTLLALISLQQAHASIVCHTPRMNKIFEVKETKVTFFNEFDSQNKRELASVTARSKTSEQGVTRYVDFENHKHVIHIKDVNNFSDVNDYIIIKGSNGHEITYPLTCSNK